MPLFLQFFKKYNYLPRGLSLYNFKYFEHKSFRYFKSLFFVKGFKYKSMKQLSVSLFYFSNILSFKDVSYLYRFNINYQLHITNLFNSLPFIFFFSFRKLNKKLYKYSNYKRKRYSLNFTYLPKYRRLKSTLKFAVKSIIYTKSLKHKSRVMLFLNYLYLTPCDLFFYKYISYIQFFIFKKKLNQLLYPK